MASGTSTTKSDNNIRAFATLRFAGDALDPDTRRARLALQREVDPAEALDHVTETPDARTAAQRAEIVARTNPSATAASTGTDEEVVSWRA